MKSLKSRFVHPTAPLLLIIVFLVGTGLAASVAKTRQPAAKRSSAPRATTPASTSKAKVSAVSQSAGNQLCLECHAKTAAVTANTRHAQAGVQCLSCHVSAARHAANPEDPLARPGADLTGAICRECHSGSSHPTYEEWKASDHAKVVAKDRTSNSCGRCHSQAVRLSLLKNEPVQGSTSNGVACVTCHDPHANYVWKNVMTGDTYTSPLRNPLSSTNDYFLSPSDVFAKKYNPQINICAQCHNHAGATWTNSSAPPHRSPQYNMLLGTVGVLPAGVSGGPAAHAGTYFLFDNVGRSYLVTNQCVTCHMQTKEPQPGPPQVAAVTGHKFVVDTYGACADCHGSGDNAQGLTDFVREIVVDEIRQVKTLLDIWAATKASSSLYAKYGTRAWEYTTPGDLSSGGPGPNATEQRTLIPDNIKKARFNLYLAHYDGSYGVHNGPHTFTLLDAAWNWVAEELDR